MNRNICTAVFILLMVGACARTGAYNAPVDNSELEIEQMDRSATYFIDPALDALVLEFDCSPIETLTYDYGNTVGDVVRETFERSFAQATEVDPESADYIFAFDDAYFEYYAEKQMFSYDTKFTVGIRFGLVQSGSGDPQMFTVTARENEDVYGSFCGVMPDVISRMTPTLMHRVARAVSTRLHDE